MKIYRTLVVFILAALIFGGCAPTPETYSLRSELIEGKLSVLSPEMIEFVGRVKGDPGGSFWLFSQEEGVGEGKPNWTLMDCSVSTLDSDGEAYANCSAEVNRKQRQNALVLSYTENPADKVERIEYRENIIVGTNEEFELLDYRQQQLGVSPSTVRNALTIYHALDLEMGINDDFNRYPPNEPLNERYAPSRGYYLTFVTEIGCYGRYTGNHVNLYHWRDGSWVFVQSVRLEDVDFNHSSGTYNFNVEGFTVSLEYHNHYKCRRQYERVNIP